MTKEELIKFLEGQFPKAIGFVLTGSQSRNKVFNTISDIDVIVFDTNNSDVYSGIVQYEKYRIDSSVVPIFDIENVILNEFYDIRGALLNMISTGTILADTNNIIQDIQTAIKPLIDKINIRVKSIYQKSVGELLKMRKYFERDLNEGEKVLLVSDFIYTISKIELIKFHGWDAVNLRKAKLLQEHNKEFVDEIVKLHNKASEEKDIQFLIGYIDHYHKTLIELRDEDTTNIVFDIAIPNFSIQQFCEKILPEIISNPPLNDCYRYFYTSPLKQHRLYKNNISICFKIKENITVVNIINELSKTLNPAKEDKPSRFEIIHPLVKYRDSVSTNTIEDLRVSLSGFAKALILHEKEIKQKPADMALLLCLELQSLLKLDVEDVCYLNTFLMQRWLLSYSEQNTKAEYQRLSAIGKERQKLWDNQYQARRKQFQYIMDTQVNIAKFNLPEQLSALYKQNVKKLEELIKNKEINFKTLYLPDSLLEYIQLSKIEEGRKYLVLAEEVLQILNVKDNDKAYYLYIMSKGLMELFFTESK